MGDTSMKSRRAKFSYDLRDGRSPVSTVDDVTHKLGGMQLSSLERSGAGLNRVGAGRRRYSGSSKGGSGPNRGGTGSSRGGSGPNIRGGTWSFSGATGPFRGGTGPVREDPRRARESPGPVREGPEPVREGPGPFRGGRGQNWGGTGRGSGWHPHSAKRPSAGSMGVTVLETLKDWTNLTLLEPPSRIVTKLLHLESSWVKSLQTDAPVEVLNLAFDILSTISLQHRYAKMALLKSLFTDDFIVRLVQIVKMFRSTWLQEGKGKVQSFMEKLRNNMEFVLSNVEGFHIIKSHKVSVEMLVGECVGTLKHIGNELTCLLGTSDADLKLEIEALKTLLEIKYGEMVIMNELHPNDFRNLLEVEANIVHGAYLSENHYIETHISLLKEDFQSVLREGVQQYLGDPKTRNFNIWSYENVVIKRFFPAKDKFKQSRKLLFEVTFPGQTKYFSKINWKSVKRFMFGSLVVITADKFKSYYLASVEDTFLDKPSAISVVVSFLYYPPNGVEDTKYLLVEPKAFYEPYLNSMKVLKLMAKIGLPLKEYIVDAYTERDLPGYLRPGSVYQIGPHEVKLDQILSWSKVDLGLNPSQKEAFFHALTSEMALIQGPPGTGKTFLALKIIETVLNNCQKSIHSNSIDGRIMVVCYKNHSLDQILDRLLKNGIKVVRLGGGSKNPLLQNEYNYRSLTTPRAISHIVTEQRALQEQLKTILSSIYRAVSLIGLIKARIGVLNLGTLKISGEFHLSLEEWLLKTEVPHLSLEQIEQQRKDISDSAGSAHRNMSDYFKMDLLSAGNAVISYRNTLSDMEEVRELLSAEKRVEFLELKEQYSHVYALYCSLHYGLNSAVDHAECPDSMPRSRDYSRMKLEERWAVYRKWESDLVERLETEIHDLQLRVPEIEETLSEYDQLIMGLKMKHSSAQVIGVTTTGASKNFSALAYVGPKMVLVEEAAEVLEAHVITSLSNKCRHLILIGDHQQLKPSTASYTLATQYRMDVSLFERMIKNGMKMSSLATQHRMRPEIAALICPSIYEKLANHRSVENYPNVLGTKKNVYFFDHTHQEESGVDSESKCNPGEAEMLAAIARYLLKQGYSPDEITILSTYMDQNLLIKQIIDKKYAGTGLKNVLCTVVDNYQGEENIIILLSLVRSNLGGQIGFLKTKNRICVALSRAKHGLFIFGNMSCLTMRQSEIWHDINRVVAGQDAISMKFPLKCLRHGNITEVACPKDVEKLKNGGCINPCSTLLHCGHICRVMCHCLDLEHIEEFICRQQCMKKCNNGHTCRALCQKPCPPCLVKMTKILVCGHQKQLECHQDNCQAYCTETVETKLELCGHNQRVLCKLTEPSMKNRIVCQSKCEGVLGCGHICKKVCHVLADPNHKEYQCEERCPTNKSCPQKHRCKRKCREYCGACLVQVEKSLPCGHKAKMECGKSVAGFKCTEKCSRKLPCDHDCANECIDPCGPCKIRVEKIITECGHSIKFKCSETPRRSHCKQRCHRIKPCRHECGDPTVPELRRDELAVSGDVARKEGS